MVHVIKTVKKEKEEWEKVEVHGDRGTAASSEGNQYYKRWV